ncbi:MAG: sigma-70 family RNA polymerase sigma factor [Pyrinomonadaceae bacterium]
MVSNTRQVTKLLNDWSNGNENALETLMPLVYSELRKMAKHHMRNQPSGHTFQTTELIHEAYLKLASNDDKKWENRTHFFAVAARAMRHILVDHARLKATEKRGDNPIRIELDEAPLVSPGRASEIIALNDALVQLESLDTRKCRVVELKFFGGLTLEEIAEVVGVTRETIKRDWKFSRAWLLSELSVKGN